LGAGFGRRKVVNLFENSVVCLDLFTSSVKPRVQEATVGQVVVEKPACGPFL
jgi:hypothetical protein